jgi:TRAP-type transport system small permease protein
MRQNQYFLHAGITHGAKSMRKIIASLGMISGFVLVLIMGLMCAEVFGRYFFNYPILGTVEISSYLLVLFVYCGTSYTQSVDGHIKIDLVTSRIPPRWMKFCKVASHLLSLAVFSLITRQAALAFWKSWQIGEVRWGAVPLPIYPVKFIVAMGALMLCIQLLIDVIDTLKLNLNGMQKGK